MCSDITTINLVPIDKDKGRMFGKCIRRVAMICRATREMKKTRYALAKYILNRALTPLYRVLKGVCLKELRKYTKEPGGSNLGFRDLIHRIDKSINWNDQCDGCGTCAQVCPAQNIAMIEGRPNWLHHSEMCLACAEWCPRKAVHHCMRADGNAYHHPNVQISDMAKQAKV